MYKKWLLNKIIERVKVKYRLIPKEQMKMGKGIWNHKCHLNAVQEVKDNNHDKVILCCGINNNRLYVHFINKDDTGCYTDNTLGWQYEYIDYYRIKEIDEKEFSNIEDILTNTKKYLINSHGIKLFNKFIDEDNFI